MFSFLIGTVVVLAIIAVICFAYTTLASRSASRHMERWDEYVEDQIQDGPTYVKAQRERIAALDLETKRIDLQTKQAAHEMQLQHDQRMEELNKQYGRSQPQKKGARVVGGSSTNERTRVDLKRLH